MPTSSGRQSALLLLLALVAGCSDPSSPRSIPQFSISPAEQWSGGSVTVRSELFVGRNTLPAVVVDAETLAVSRLDDSTASVRLPVRASGPVLLRVVRGSRIDSIGTVQIYGFAARADVSPGFPGSMLVVGRRGTDPIVLGEGPAAEVVQLDPGAASATSRPEFKTPGGYYGVGITRHPDQFLLRDTLTDTLAVWQLWPASVRITVPPAYETGFVRLANRMSDTTWLFTSSHWTSTVGSVNLSFLPTEDSWALFNSPRGDRTAMALATTSLPGAPVFSSLTGDTAYTIQGIRNVRWAGFSPDGAELIVMGHAYYSAGPDSILVLDATSGQRLRGVLLPDSAQGRTLAVDPEQDFLYVQVIRGCGPQVLVYRFSDLAPIGELGAEGPIPTCANGTWEGALAVDRARGKLFLVWNGDPAPVWTFDLLP